MGDWPAAFELEAGLWRSGRRLLAGIDEVGRGPLAGPVVVAAVVLPPGLFIAGVTDSKRLSAKRRAELATVIRARALGCSVGAASAREVDELNVLRATHLAMQRAVTRLRPVPDHLLVDGLPVALLGGSQTAVVGGDRVVHCISCASIVAKVVRDELMRRLDARHPGYGWARNAGYATSEHTAALRRLGPSPHHRRSFGSQQLGLELGT